MTANNIKDWEYDEGFYEGADNKKVRSFEEIAAECEQLMATPSKDDLGSESTKLKELAEKIGKIKKLSAEGTDVNTISETLGYDSRFVSDVLITISGSPEDDSDMAIAHILMIE